MPYNISIKFHPIPSTLNFSRFVEKFKMAAVAMVTKVQNGRQMQKSSDMGEIWFPSRL
jgi:hypothetical protein